MYTTKDKPSLYQDSRPILDACRRVILLNSPAQLCTHVSDKVDRCSNAGITLMRITKLY